MKKLFPSAALITALTLLAAGSAGAHEHSRDGRLMGYTPCGKPIIAYHEVVGRDRCGRNIWEWVTHYPSSCRCRDHGHNDRWNGDRHHGHEGSRGDCRRPGWSFFRF